MEIKILDKDTYVFLTKNGKTYRGSAFCHEDDNEFYSEIFGGRLAEIRAWKSYVQDKVNELRTRRNNIKDFIKTCEQYKKFNTESKECSIMHKELERVEEELDKWLAYRELCRKHIRELITSKEKANTMITAVLQNKG